MVLKNKKGFVLSEAIVVAIFILGMFTFLATNILPLISKYDRIATYDNPEEVYLTNTLYDALYQADKLDDIDLGIYVFSKNDDNTISYTKDGGSSNVFDQYYKDLIYDYLQISKIVFFESQIENISINTNYSRSIREYYKYFKTRNNVEGKMVMLIEFQNGNFANIIIG